jgi:S1-C subfamily serine protease
MELSDEDKKRILEEEQRRLAEEQFRAEVRRGLVSGTGAADSLPAKSKTLRAVLITLGVVLAVCVVLFVIVNHRVPAGSHSVTSTADSAAQPAQPETADRPSALSPPPPTTLTTAQIADGATPSVVVVENFNEDGEKAGQGSGYVYSTDGTVITNYHVIRGASSVTVRSATKESYRVDSLVGYDVRHDLAALHAEGISAPALSTEDAQLAKVGDRVVAIGAPLGLESTVSEGIVSALRNAGDMRILQTTASISPGSSGGPLLNEYGKVIGVTAAYLVNGQNLNFVIAAQHITQLLALKRSISLAQMLTETAVVNPVPGDTVSVPARNSVTFNIPVVGQQGAVLVGNYSIRGGVGNDVAVYMKASDGRVIFDSGRVKSFGQIKQRLGMGAYTLVFDNRFSALSSKSISPSLRLVSFR